MNSLRHNEIVTFHHGPDPGDGGRPRLRAEVGRLGPFREGTQTIVVTVSNKGSRGSKATCTFRALDPSERELATATILTEPIPGHGSISVTRTFRGLPDQPAGYDTVCT